MPANRFFVPQTLVEQKEYSLSFEESKHLKVHRPSIGESIQIINGKNQLADASFIRWEKQIAVVFVNTVEKRSAPEQKIILYQSVIKSSKADWILEKGCELGVHQFVFFLF